MAKIKKMALALFVLIVLAFYVFPLKKSDTKLVLGVTFSKPFAEFMGLDWKETYLVILDDLGAK